MKLLNLTLMNKQLSRVARIVLALVGVAMLACSSSSIATDWHFGEALAIRVKEVRLVDHVSYSFEEEHYRIEPTQGGYKIAAALIEMRSRDATVAYLSVNKGTVRLRDSTFVDYSPIDPFEDRTKVSEDSSLENTIIPFVWGEIALPQKCGDLEFCEIMGWILFEVPDETGLHQLIWDTGDTIFLRF
jgi:hypothetical protein